MKMMFNGKDRQVVKAYNGKRGCMCGCNGNYVDSDGRAMTMRVNKVMSFVGPMRPDSNDRASYSSKSFGGDFYFAVDDGDRTTAVYFR